MKRQKILFSLTLSDGLICKVLPDSWVSLDGRVVQFSALAPDTKKQIIRVRNKVMRGALLAKDHTMVQILANWGK